MPTNGAPYGGAKVLHAPADQAMLDRFASAPGKRSEATRNGS